MLRHSVVSDSLRPHGLWPPGSSVHGVYPGKNTAVGLPCPPPGHLPNPGINLESLPLRTDSLLSEPSGKPKNTGVGSPSLLQGIFLIQESNQGLLHRRRILYQLNYRVYCIFVLQGDEYCSVKLWESRMSG